ncbi:hypothetical protein DZ860_23455 [Vibrio sinensis]|uniref:Uncharacterized protein n=1 Tax=Vibrio sinensis TaxID=2302434 RepID=A0A3A6QFU2_9VIBR|nr:hypothetical protein DZ860_23455 [Vibrio sinensis]
MVYQLHSNAYCHVIGLTFIKLNWLFFHYLILNILFTADVTKYSIRFIGAWFLKNNSSMFCEIKAI